MEEGKKMGEAGDVSCGRERKQRNVKTEQRGPENTSGAAWCVLSSDNDAASKVLVK